MLSDEDLEQVKMQIAMDLAEVRSEYDAKIAALHHLVRFWQAKALTAMAHVTPAEYNRQQMTNLVDLLRDPIGSHYVGETEAESAVYEADQAISYEGQSAETAAIAANAQDRTDIDALIRDANDLFARTKETEEVQHVMSRRLLNWQLTMTRLFCKMDYVHQGDIHELLAAATMDHRTVPRMDTVMAQMDVVLDKLADLPEQPDNSRARDELDNREERAIMLDVH